MGDPAVFLTGDFFAAGFAAFGADFLAAGFAAFGALFLAAGLAAFFLVAIVVDYVELGALFSGFFEEKHFSTARAKAREAMQRT